MLRYTIVDFANILSLILQCCQDFFSALILQGERDKCYIFAAYLTLLQTKSPHRGWRRLVPRTYMWVES